MTAPTVPFYPITHDDGLSIVSALNGLVDVNDTPSLLADPFDEAISYAVGNYVIYAGALYRFTSAHSAGPWNSNHVTQVLAMGELQPLNSYLIPLSFSNTSTSINLIANSNCQFLALVGTSSAIISCTWNGNKYNYTATNLSGTVNLVDNQNNIATLTLPAYTSGLLVGYGFRLL